MRQFANYFENKPVKANLESKIEGICEVINYQGIFCLFLQVQELKINYFFLIPQMLVRITCRRFFSITEFRTVTIIR